MKRGECMKRGEWLQIRQRRLRRWTLLMPVWCTASMGSKGPHWTLHFFVFRLCFALKVLFCFRAMAICAQRPRPSISSYLFQDWTGHGTLLLLLRTCAGGRAVGPVSTPCACVHACGVVVAELCTSCCAWLRIEGKRCYSQDGHARLLCMHACMHACTQRHMIRICKRAELRRGARHVTNTGDASCMRKPR